MTGGIGKVEVRHQVVCFVGGRRDLAPVKVRHERHRLASFLLRLAQKEGKHSAAGVEIALPASNQELASHIGTVRELVSRNLSRLQAEGMLKVDGRTVTISNLKALEAEMDSPE